MFKILTVACFAIVIIMVHGDVNSAVNKQACIRDTSVNPSFVERAENGDVNDARELKCYFKCYYENAGYMDESGAIQADKFRANIPAGISKAMANRAIDLCSARKGKDAKDTCETAYQVQKCMLENNLKF